MATTIQMQRDGRTQRVTRQVFHAIYEPKGWQADAEELARPDRWFLDDPAYTAWLKGAEPSMERVNRGSAYLRTLEEWRRLRDREGVITASQRAIARELVALSPGTIAGAADANAPDDPKEPARVATRRDDLVREHSGLGVEASILPELRVDAARAYLDASRRLGSLVAHQADRERVVCHEAGMALEPEVAGLRRALNARGVSPAAREAKEQELAALYQQRAPIARREDVCSQAKQAAQSLVRDEAGRNRFLDEARKGRS